MLLVLASHTKKKELLLTFRNTQIKGGVGRFTGGDPAVYFSNAFSNNGFAVGFGQTGRDNCFVGSRAASRLAALRPKPQPEERV